MEELIRDGALRLLTSEVSCDVILSCRGYKLRAHKVILSIASPVLQNLLLQDDTAPTVIIFPDISETTMTLLLDYIYTGSVNIRSDMLTEFIGIANELKLRISTEAFKITPKYKKDSINELETESKSMSVVDCDIYKCENRSSITNKRPTSSDKSNYQRKCLKKIPALVPISTLKRKNTPYNHIVPSPWCPRGAPLLADPRENRCSVLCGNLKDKIEQSDRNNNLKIQIAETTTPPFRETLPNNNRNNISDKHTSFSHYDSELDITLNDSTDSDINNGMCLPLDMKKRLFNTDKDVEQNDSKIGKSAVKRIAADENDEYVKGHELTKTRKHDTKKPFNCGDCGKSFSQLRNFKYHRSIHEGTKEFSARCPECGKTFNDKGYLSSHMKIHRDRKEYGCPHCPKRFNQRVAYNMHLRIHTGIKPHECPTCGKTFSRKMLLKQHQRVHTGERPYSCPECGKSFADRSNMSLHARLHTGVKPYTCNLCSKSFTKKHHLKTHMNFHTGLKPYSCQNCGLAFSQSSNMRTHYKKCILKPTDTSENENT